MLPLLYTVLYGAAYAILTCISNRTGVFGALLGAECTEGWHLLHGRTLVSTLVRHASVNLPTDLHATHSYRQQLRCYERDDHMGSVQRLVHGQMPSASLRSAAWFEFVLMRELL